MRRRNMNQMFDLKMQVLREKLHIFFLFRQGLEGHHITSQQQHHQQQQQHHDATLSWMANNTNSLLEEESEDNE